ncbi:M23 family metallopeptidase [Polyangium fumosum]|uniref:M23 family metallopeptidase n=2 Tax=Polyangium fumosum TaxID=889272 RepID=A0A4U1JH26_9BACT|nr:M23 family metallopeptidase [Polyangium fumosum]
MPFASRTMRSRLFLLAMLPLACSSPGASSSSGSGGEGGSSSTTGPGTGGAGMGGGGGMGGMTSSTGVGPGSGSGGSLPMLPCDAGFAFDSNPITSPILTVSYTNQTPYAYVNMKVTGPGAPASQWGGVGGSGPYTWTYTVYGYDPGVLTFTFVEGENGGNPGNPVAQCQIEALVEGSTNPGSSGSGGGGQASCADLAQANGWPGGTFTCDDGTHNWCAGTGTPTSDCVRCCSPSCGVLAQLYNSSASCDDGNNGACKGSGVLTWDCKAGCCGPGIPNSQPPTGGAFGYPVGDKSTSPAGGAGWQVWQVLGHYWDVYGGAHLAEDIGKAGAANAAVSSVADGVVLVSAPNGSSYVNVILIQHPMPNGTSVCSFYGHLATRTVSPGQTVKRGDQIGTVLDQGSNSHLHYFIAPKSLCDKIAGLNGGGACGYDGSGGVPGLGHADLANAPESYTASGTNNGCSLNGYQILAPHDFIDAHHF